MNKFNQADRSGNKIYKFKDNPANIVFAGYLLK